jgi:hypothetical protein
VATNLETAVLQRTAKAARALAELGVDAGAISAFKPRLICELAPSAGSGELVLGMTGEHLRLAEEQGALGPGFLLPEALSKGHEIKDPYFEGGFEGVFREIAACIDALVAGR